MSVRQFENGMSSCHGVALVAVLWIVSALSILTIGMLQAQRDEIRLNLSARQSVEGSAIGSAAIQIVLQGLAGRSDRVNQLSRVEVGYAGLKIPVEIIPINGFIDINRASESLLTALFAAATKMNFEQAGVMARAVIAVRTSRSGVQNGRRFEAIEDLLQVPEIDYSIYSKLSSLITTDAGGSGRVNPMAAPESVLMILSEGKIGRATRIAVERDRGAVGVDTTDLTAHFIDSAVVNRFKLVARVPFADGRQLISSRMAEIGRASSDGVPWHIFHAEDRFESPPAATY